MLELVTKETKNLEVEGSLPFWINDECWPQKVQGLDSRRLFDEEFVFIQSFLNFSILFLNFPQPARF
jgi:hypothetical protein